MSLVARSIVKSFGAVTVLRGLSLEFAPGTVTAIVGDNGAGKSTLLKVLAGVYAPERGEIYLNGKMLSEFSPNTHRAAGIEMVFQDLALAKNHSVVANLFLGRELSLPFGRLDRSEMLNQAKSAIRDLDIDLNDIEAKAGSLSGGQQQAVAIARALMFKPNALLLDEPTAALAVREIDRVLALIKKQRDQGRIVILVSHRLNDVFAVADRIVVLKHGEVFSDDPASALDLTTVVKRIVS